MTGLREPFEESSIPDPFISIPNSDISSRTSDLLSKTQQVVDNRAVATREAATRERLLQIEHELQQAKRLAEVAGVRRMAEDTAVLLKRRGCSPPTIPVLFFTPTLPKGLHRSLLKMLDRPRYTQQIVSYQPHVWPVVVNEALRIHEPIPTGSYMHNEYTPQVFYDAVSPIGLRVDGALVTYPPKPLHSFDATNNPFTDVGSYDPQKHEYVAGRNPAVKIVGEYQEAFSKALDRYSQMRGRLATNEEIAASADAAVYAERFSVLAAASINSQLANPEIAREVGVGFNAFGGWIRPGVTR